MRSDINLNTHVSSKLPQWLSYSYKIPISTPNTIITDRDCKGSKEKTSQSISQDFLHASLTATNFVYENPSEDERCDLKRQRYISYKDNGQSNTLFTKIWYTNKIKTTSYRNNSITNLLAVLLVLYLVTVVYQQHKGVTVLQH